MILQQSMDHLMNSINSDYIMSNRKQKLEMSRNQHLITDQGVFQEIKEQSLGDETSNNSNASRHDNSGILAINQEIEKIAEESQADEIKAIGDISSQFEVLIVNDEPMNILILETMFESLGC